MPDPVTYRVREAASILGVTPQTVRKYARQGKIEYIVTPGGQWVYPKASINELAGIKNDDYKPETPVKAAFYIRTSDYSPTRQKEQYRQLKELYGDPKKTYKDSSSGLNENRKGLKHLITDIKNGEINTVYITQQDRLTRFGYKYLEELFSAYNAKIIIAFDKPNKSMYEELMQDFMSLVASFSGKFYRMRGYEQQRQLVHDAEERINEKQRRAQAMQD